MGIEILPPDVNLSDHEFVVVDGNIRFGLDAVKGVGYAAVEAIKRGARGGGPFTSLWDFCERVDCRAVNKKAIEALIKCGAFGSTGATRRGCSRCSSPRRRPARRRSSTRRSARARSSTSAASATDGGGVAVRGAGAPADPDRGVRPAELLAIEKESIGLFITEHPLKRVREALRVKGDTLVRRGRRAPRRRVGQGRRHDRGVEEDQDPVGLDGDVRDARRPRRPGRAARVREGDPGQRGERCSPTRSCSCAAPSTTARTARSASRSPTSTPFDPSEAEIERAREQAAALAAARAAPAAPARRRRPAPGVGDRRAQAHLRGLPGRVRGRARGPHPHRPAQAALRRRVQGRRPQRGAQGRARPRARRRVCPRAGAGSCRRARRGRGGRRGPGGRASMPAPTRPERRRPPRARRPRRPRWRAHRGADPAPRSAPARRFRASRCARRGPPRAARTRAVDVLAIDGLARCARPLEHARQALEARLGQERGDALAADLAVAEVGVAVAVGAQRRRRVVDVQRAEPVEPDDAVELVEHARERLGACGCRSRRRAGGRSRGRRRAARRRRATSISRASSSNERPSVPPAPAVSSRCSGHVSDSSSASAITAAGAVERGVHGAAVLERRARVQHDAVRAQRRARAQRRGQRGERLLADLGVLEARVEQVDGVDQSASTSDSAIAAWKSATSSSPSTRAASTGAGSG